MGAYALLILPSYGYWKSVECSKSMGSPPPGIASTTKSLVILYWALEGVKRKSFGLIILTSSS